MCLTSPSIFLAGEQRPDDGVHQLPSSGILAAAIFPIAFLNQFFSSPRRAFRD
jgi:hypothetical protein